MKKKMFLLFGIVLFVIGFSVPTYAKEVFYTTPNGIELTEKEYEYLSTIYWDTYPDEMTEEQYEEFLNSDLLTRNLQVKTKIVGNPSVRGTWHQSAYKKIQISSACSTDCIITLTNDWLQDPAIRSFDVIGTRLSGVSLISHNFTYVSSTSGYNYFYNTKEFSNGLGNSVKLPDTGSNIRIVHQITTTTGGIVFGSYQHAMSNTTLPVSKYYNINGGGYGSVFDFYGSAYGIYDGFGGVDITI